MTTSQLCCALVVVGSMALWGLQGISSGGGSSSKANQADPNEQIRVGSIRTENPESEKMSRLVDSFVYGKRQVVRSDDEAFESRFISAVGRELVRLVIEGDYETVLRVLLKDKDRGKIFLYSWIVGTKSPLGVDQEIVAQWELAEQLNLGDNRSFRRKFYRKFGEKRSSEVLSPSVFRCFDIRDKGNWIVGLSSSSHPETLLQLLPVIEADAESGPLTKLAIRRFSMISPVDVATVLSNYSGVGRSQAIEEFVACLEELGALIEAEEWRAEIMPLAGASE